MPLAIASALAVASCTPAGNTADVIPVQGPTLLIVNESGENVRVELDGRALPYLPVNASQCVVLLQRQLGRIAVKAANGTVLAAARVSERTWTRRGWTLILRAPSPRSYRYELLALLPAAPCEVPRSAR